MKVTLISITPNAEEFIANAARVCYASEPKTPDANKKLLGTLREMDHMSTFEHASATFLIDGISRACSHQLVRHRVASYSQQSQRYVNEEGFDYITPPAIEEKPEAKKIFEDGIDGTRRAYKELIGLGIPKEDARFILPNACSTKIVVTMNFRELRHFIKLRSDKTAQWEIRKLAQEMMILLKKEVPIAFDDLE